MRKPIPLKNTKFFYKLEVAHSILDCISCLPHHCHKLCTVLKDYSCGTIQGQRLFHSALLGIHLQLDSGTMWGWCLIGGIWITHTCLIARAESLNHPVTGKAMNLIIYVNSIMLNKLTKRCLPSRALNPCAVYRNAGCRLCFIWNQHATSLLLL